MLADGRLPVAGGVAAAGAVGNDGRRRRRPFLQSSTYVRLYTGVDVREHGIYSDRIRGRAPTSGHAHVSMQVSLNPQTIWERLTEARASAHSIVESHDPGVASGGAWRASFVSGWEFKDRMVTLRVALRPRGRARPALVQPLWAAAAPRRRVRATETWMTSLCGWRDRLVAGSAAGRVADGDRPRCCRRVVVRRRRGSTSAAAHKAGHQLWDPSAVVAEPLADDVNQRLQDGIEEVYEAVDRADWPRIVKELPDRQPT